MLNLVSVLEGTAAHLSSALVQQGASLVQTGGAFYHHHLFLLDEEEQHQVLLTEPKDQLNHPAERGGVQQGEAWGAQGHHRGYEIDAAALTKIEKTRTTTWLEKRDMKDLGMLQHIAETSVGPMLAMYLQQNIACSSVLVGRFTHLWKAWT